MDVNKNLPVLKEPETDFELKRYAKAMSGECTPLCISIEDMSGEFSGSHGTYHTTLEDCDCRDHRISRLPCKHMYRLAIELGLTNAVAETAKEKIQVPELRYTQDKKESFVKAIELLEAKPEMLNIAENIMYQHKLKSEYVCYDISEIQYLIDNSLVRVRKDPVVLLKSLGQRKVLKLLSESGYALPSHLELQRDRYAWCLENADNISEILFPNYGIIDIAGLLEASYARIYSYLIRRGKASEYRNDYSWDYHGILDGLDPDVAELLCKYDEDFKKTYEAAPSNVNAVRISVSCNKTEKETKTENVVQSSKLTDLKFVISGKFTIPFLDMAELIVDNGGMLLASVDEKVSYLVVGVDPKTERVEKANNIGVPVITEQELMDMLK